MKFFFKKYLREKRKNNRLIFSWYQLSIIDIFLVFFVPILIINQIGDYLQKEELLGIKIIDLNQPDKTILNSLIVCLILYLTLNRKSILKIGKQKIYFKKRLFAFRTWRFLKNEIKEITMKQAKNYHENTVAFYPDLYKLTLVLNNGKKIRLGSFNEKDCNRIKRALNE